MERYEDRIAGRLRKQGLKITPQRIAILRCLAGNRDHPSVEEIYREVLSQFPTISLATVYNTLGTLEEIREVQPITFDASRKRYDPDMSLHHHVICDRCGVIRDVFVDYSEQFAVPAAISQEFRIEQALVCFRGLCRRCAGRIS